MTNPVIPKSSKYPTGQRINISLAFANNKDRWQRAAMKINNLIEQIPFIKTDVPKSEAPKIDKSQKRTKTLARNADYVVAGEVLGLKDKELEYDIDILTNAVKYEYQIDSSLMNIVNHRIDSILTEEILGGSKFWTDRFWMNYYVTQAADKGVEDSFNSALNITQGTESEQSLAVTSVRQQLQSPIYQDRLNMLNGRVFELMNGLTADTKAQLRFTLSESVVRGLGIRDIKGMINNRMGISMARAERIARTEINNAYTNAYMKESQELNDTYLKDDPWEIKQCHRSALIATTRTSHAFRHGTVSTVAEQLQWWGENGRINCYCATIDVLVHRKTGEILQKTMVDRMLSERPKFIKITKKDK